MGEDNVDWGAVETVVGAVFPQFGTVGVWGGDAGKGKQGDCDWDLGDEETQDEFWTSPAL